MLPLDHIPFYTPDPDALAEGFARLGFTPAPTSIYTAPDHPPARWVNRSVLTRSGWLDLIREPEARRAGAPGAVLFRTDDLAATCAQMAALEPEPPFRLQLWSGDVAGEPFAYASLAARIAPVPVAVIEHAWPPADVGPEAFEHPNGALAVSGLIFAGEPRGSFPEAAAVLDLSVFRYLSAADFEAAFPQTPSGRAVRVRVGDLAVTRAALATAGATFVERDGVLLAPAQAGVNCGLAFSAAG